MGGNITGGSLMGGNYPGENFPGRNFARTHYYNSESLKDNYQIETRIKLSSIS